jgi:hypothetical protein
MVLRRHRRSSVRPWLRVALVAAAASALLFANLDRISTTRSAGKWPTYEDVTDKANLHFRHSLGEQKLSSVMEATGSGCVWFDYNNDGLLDLYVLSGRFIDGVTNHSKPDGVDATNHLYRNNGDGTFTDVTAQAGVPGKGFAMGTTISTLPTGIPRYSITTTVMARSRT